MRNEVILFDKLALSREKNETFILSPVSFYVSSYFVLLKTLLEDVLQDPPIIFNVSFGNLRFYTEHAATQPYHTSFYGYLHFSPLSASHQNIAQMTVFIINNNSFTIMKC